jgi:predicted transcriptional regulator
VILGIAGWGSALFCLVMSVHVIWWHFAKPKKEILVLLGTFFDLPFLILLMAWLAADVALLSCAAVYGWHLALALIYIQTYPAIKSQIPTFDILFHLDQANRGLTHGEMIKELDQESKLFTDKVEELKNDGLVQDDGKNYSLTPAGQALAGVYALYRRILGLSPGKG